MGNPFLLIEKSVLRRQYNQRRLRENEEANVCKGTQDR